MRVSVEDLNMSPVSVYRHCAAMGNACGGVLHSHDARQAELPRDDGAMRKHPPSLDHQAAYQGKDRRPSRVCLARNQDVARLKQVRIRQAGEDRGTRCDFAAADTGAREIRACRGMVAPVLRSSGWAGWAGWLILAFVHPERIGSDRSG